MSSIGSAGSDGSDGESSPDEAVVNLALVGRELRQAARALRASRIEAALCESEVYTGAKTETVRLAKLIFRTSFPMSVAAVQDVCEFCKACSNMTYADYCRNFSNITITLDKLRRDVILCREVSKLMAAKSKNLKDRMDVKIGKQERKQTCASAKADVHKEASEGAKRLASGLDTGSWTCAGATVGSTIGLALAAAPVAIPVAVVGGAVLTGTLAGGSYLAESRANEHNNKAAEAEEESIAIQKLIRGMKKNLLASAKDMSKAMDTISAELHLLSFKIRCLEKKSQDLAKAPQAKALFTNIQERIESISSACTEFLKAVIPATTCVESLTGSIDDLEVEKLFRKLREDNSEAQHILDHMGDATPLLETLNIDRLELGDTILSRRMGASQQEEDYVELVGAGKSLKKAISLLPQNFQGCESSQVFGVYHAWVLPFTRALAHELKDHCTSIENLRLGHAERVPEFTDILPSYIERLQLGSDMHDCLAEGLQGVDASEGWQASLPGVLEITKQSLLDVISNLETMKTRGAGLKRKQSDFKRNNFFNDVQTNALESKKACVKYLEYFGDRFAGMPPDSFREFGVSVVPDWLQRQEAIRAKVQSVANHEAYRHVFEPWVEGARLLI